MIKRILAIVMSIALIVSIAVISSTATASAADTDAFTIGTQHLLTLRLSILV